MQEHLIKTLTIDVQLEKELGHSALSDEVAAAVESKLLPQLEAAFGKMAVGDLMLELPYFELDLGQLNVNSIENGIENWVREQLGRELVRLNEEINRSIGKRIPIDWQLFFLKNGHLPWYVPSMDLREMEASLLNTFEAKIWAWMQGQNDILIFERLVIGRPKSFQDKLLKMVFKQQSERLDFVFQSLQKTATHEELTLVALVSSAALTADKNEQDFGQKLVEVVATYLGKRIGEAFTFEPKIAMQLFEIAWKLRFRGKPPSSVTLEKLQLILSKSNMHRQNWAETAVQILAKEFGIAEGKKAVFEQNESSSIGGLGDETDAIYLPYAGQVLMAPYLPMLFEKIGLVQEGSFKDKKSQKLAVQLTGFLATGQTNLMEHQLFLGKILCGWPVELPVPGRFQLKKQLREECQKMLTALIANWGALGDSSPAALQEAFFDREGRLSGSTFGWVLRVDQRSGFDLLLEKIPWGFGHIKLPWMPNLLMVEWI